MVNSVIAGSTAAAGATDTLWLPICYSLGFGVIAALALSRGEGGWSAIDIVCVFGAACGFAVWLFFGAPAAASLLLVIVDAVGLAPTVAKAFYRPWTEDRNAWALATGASAFNCLALDRPTIIVAAYPAYLLISNTVILALIARGAARAARL